MTMTFTERDQKVFNALCNVVIYNYCDLLRKAGTSIRFLIKQGIMTNAQDAEAAYESYEAMVIDYALDKLPKKFKPTYGWYGERVITNRGYGTRSGGYFRGDSDGHIMWFDRYEALIEYTLGVLK